MPDAPDDFEYSNVTEFSANLDSSELAARLYSPAIFARRGQVIFMTDFSRGFSGIDSTPDAATSLQNIVTTYSQQSGLALKMQTDQTDPYDNDAYVHLPYVKSRYYMVDIGYRFAGSKDYFQVVLDIAEDGVIKYGGFWHETSPAIIYLETYDTYQLDITSLYAGGNIQNLEQHMRMIIDTEDNVYKQLSLNSRDFDITSQVLDGGTSSVGSYFRLFFTNYTDTGLLSTVYVQWIVLSCFDEAS